MNGSMLCSSFKLELLQAVHNFLSDVFWVALYTSAATLDATTTTYVTAGEVSGVGYRAGGMTLTGAQTLLDPASRVAYATFANPVWLNSTIVARGALVYNQTKQQRAVAVIDFGTDRTSNLGPFYVQFPPPGPSTALIRIS